jgi:predicted nucleotidyltransferase
MEFGDFARSDAGLADECTASEEGLSMADFLLERVTPVLAAVPGVLGIALGGSRARGTANASSDYDLGLYFGSANPLDTDQLLEAVKSLVDDPDAASVTPIGGWGPWIVGGGWLSIGGRKVDLLYRNVEAVAEVIGDCRAGRIVMDYQPGHPHGFCSAIWMGEVALCQPLHDPNKTIADLKTTTAPYPWRLRQALIGRFRWEILFSIENGEIAARRNEQTHVAGCIYRALCCAAQVLFALNGRYLIHEKGALPEASQLPLTISGLPERISDIWARLGRRDFDAAFAELRTVDQELAAMVASAA